MHTPGNLPVPGRWFQDGALKEPMESDRKAKMQTNNHGKSRTPTGINRQTRDLIDALPYSVQLIDSDHKIIAVNRALQQALDMNEDKLVGEHCTLVIHKLNAAVADCPLEEALEKNQPIERELFDSVNAQWIGASVYPTRIVSEEGRPIYLHFIRNITEVKKTAAELSRSLEHHRALCDLLQNLQDCHDCTQVLDTLIEQVLSLSWLGMASTAVGFVFNGEELEIVSHRNIAPELLKKCGRIAPGECLCGKAVQTKQPLIYPSSSKEHSRCYEGMVEHRHAVLPIVHKGAILGVLTLYLKAEVAMDDFRLGFLEAATSAAAAALDAQQAREQALLAQERFLAHIISSQEDERKRVAGDLHDKLCQSLSAILLELQTKAVRQSVEVPALGEIKARVRELIDQVRQMAGQLRPTILDDFGLESALTHKIEELSSLREIKIDYQCHPSDQVGKRLPPVVEVSLYRVAMEALLNAVSHAAASRISVILLKQPDKATLLVEDNGCGFDYREVRGDLNRCKGLIEMEERMLVLRGNLEMESSSKKGTIIRAEVPIRPSLQP